MNRILSPVFLLVGLFSSAPLWAANTVTVSDVTAEAGETGVAVEIELANDDVIAGFQFTLNYPSKVLQVTEVTPGSYASSMYFAATTATTGEVEALAVAITEPDQLTPGGPGSITTVVFTVVSGAPAGEYDLLLDGVILSDPSATALGVSSYDGVLTVTESSGEEGGEDTGEEGGEEGGEDTGEEGGEEGGEDTGEADGSEDDGEDDGATDQGGEDGGEDTASAETGGEDTSTGGEDGGEDSSSGEEDAGEDGTDEGGADISDTGEDGGKDGCGCSSTRVRSLPGTLGGFILLFGWVTRRRRRRV